MESRGEEQGWVKLYRVIMESTIWHNEKYLKVFLWCLMKANHQDTKFPFNGKDITIKRGQFITGYKEALKELRFSTRSTYRNAITYLKSTNRISHQTTNRFSIITVCNYDSYQAQKNEVSHPNKPPADQQEASKGPAEGHKQECKELSKNGKNFLSEKIEKLFNDFLLQEKKSNRTVTDERIKLLVQNLNSLSSDEDTQAAIIEQAIRGNYSDFRPLPTKKPHQQNLTEMDYTQNPNEI